jgi:hypothetical protein
MGGRDQQGADLALTRDPQILGRRTRIGADRRSLGRSRIFPHSHVKSLPDCRETIGGCQANFLKQQPPTTPSAVSPGGGIGQDLACAYAHC